MLIILKKIKIRIKIIIKIIIAMGIIRVIKKYQISDRSYSLPNFPYKIIMILLFNKKCKNI